MMRELSRAVRQMNLIDARSRSMAADLTIAPTHFITEVYGGDRWNEMFTFAVSARAGDVEATRTAAQSYLDGQRKMNPELSFRGRAVVITPGGRVSLVSDMP
jgi:hypothetical protein